MLLFNNISITKTENFGNITFLCIIIPKIISHNIIYRIK